MEHSTIRFQGPFAVSAAIHILVFGAALAFAHYGEAIFGREAHVITVDLVGESGSASAGERRAAPSHATAAPAEPAMPALDSEKRTVIVPEPVKNGAVDWRGPAGSGSEESAVASAGPAGVEYEGQGGSTGPEGGLSSDQWRMLQSAIEKAKNYPRLARERGIEGVVLVRFRILPSGEVQEVNIARSSGAAILDEASVRTVQRAAPMPYVSGWIEVPMVYELK